MPTIHSLLPAYERSMRSRGQRPRGIQRYIAHLRSFLVHAGNDFDIVDLKPRDIRRFQEVRCEEVAIRTVHGALTALRSFCCWAIEEEYISTDPTTGMRWPKLPETAPKALTRQQLRRLMTALEEPIDLAIHERWQWRRNRRVILLMLFAGLRMSEVIDLRWRDVDLDNRVLVVRDGKGGRARSLPIHAALAKELNRVAIKNPEYAVAGRSDGAPVSRDHDKMFRRWLKERGVELSAHQLRHTFATELMRSGANLRYIQELMGHRSIETTQRYLLVEPDVLRVAVAQMPAAW